mmetsp:Transcript_10392/g.18820  ORF Transcript_10392/g.18820 Transcript_10392/m.18820 type:complete len:273 (+) Transcript_10392:1227-2045(+)
MVMAEGLDALLHRRLGAIEVNDGHGALHLQLEHLRLSHGAREAVDDKAVLSGFGCLLQHRLLHDHEDGFHRHQLPLRHQGGALPTHDASPRHFRAKQVARREVIVAVLLDQLGGLRPLPRPRPAEHKHGVELAHGVGELAEDAGRVVVPRGFHVGRLVARRLQTADDLFNVAVHIRNRRHGADLVGQQRGLVALDDGEAELAEDLKPLLDSLHIVIGAPAGLASLHHALLQHVLRALQQDGCRRHLDLLLKRLSLRHGTREAVEYEIVRAAL